MLKAALKYWEDSMGPAFTFARHAVLIYALIGIAFPRSGWGEQAHDPGVRRGRASAGKALGGLNIREQINFGNAAAAFSSTRNVKDGLGPAFNGDSCVMCHSHPSAGGSSPFINPQIALATRGGARNTVPAFLSLNGPIRVARFRHKLGSDGRATEVRDGGVHALFSIAGRRDGGACDLTQPDFERHAAADNLTFRIPTPVFGMGLVEAIRDSTILASFAATATRRAQLGIAGHPNRSRADGTINRFGWKAQNSSAELFSGEAYNVEMGITNELFPQERTTRQSCLLNATPEDGVTLEALLSLRSLSAVAKFAVYMRTLAPPSPGPITPVVMRGLQVFNTIGCVMCHTQAMPLIGVSSPEVGRHKSAMLFSDLMLHKMGPRLADEIVQGDAGPDEFRTAPLWGLGQRIFFLHDGRTTDLVEAIEAHASSGDAQYAPSEANAVIDRYKALGETQKQELLIFLRAL